LAVILVPPQTTDAVVRDLFGDIRCALAGVGAHLVGGHTEVTPAVNRPIVVGQMLGLTETPAPVRSGGVVPESVIVQIGPAPIEGAAVLAREASGALDELDPSMLRRARAAFDRPGISVVEPALLAAELGAVALHDPTEGGIAAGLHEMARASGVRIQIDPGALVRRDRRCRRWRDLWSTLAWNILAAFQRAPTRPCG
jgi:hydrogenase maturation factor